MYIIPAIDIINGKCVRLSQGDYASVKQYNENPLEVAKSFEDHGLQRLHLVDLDGAKHRKVINLKVLESIASHTRLEIDFGGGVQSHEDIRQVFESGARQVTAGSVAVRNPGLLQEWIDQYGSDRIILGADVKNHRIAISGWEEESSYQLDAFLKEKILMGLKYVISTDVEQDGMLAGPSFSLYEHIRTTFPVLHVIASGGVASLADLQKLKKQNLFGAIVGKAIYEGKIGLVELSEMNANPSMN